MCYGNPEQLLATILPDPLPRNRHGHTPLDDFEHFRAYSGLSEPQAGRVAFAWAKVAYVQAWISSQRNAVAAD
ncbi:hypothetical protein B0G84_4962 [Paraburkholderia sp. BL8N3]|nr:hypothetical protein [Paraburkholderia sp. BL8N3]TCK39622.1 hypothetical protein B0G84_4962 [Paraburkholderia sp. BL8N3]